MSAYRLWDYYTHPDYYVMQSAPWYTSILLWGIATAAVLAIASIIKVLLKLLSKN